MMVFEDGVHRSRIIVLAWLWLCVEWCVCVCASLVVNKQHVVVWRVGCACVCVCR